jgi:lipid II:glycine glycyltransferase (peptidoglycan interpeptide bridge formation enzyme)
MATNAGIQLAKQSGCARYDMMGAGEPGVPYGVRDFKAEFGGKLVEHGRFLCICKPSLYKIGTIGVKILKRK